MQLHQLIEKCIEWVALDGILGTEPLVLHQHLRKSDPSLDDAYFAYLFTVLVENPCIRVSLTEEPIAAPDKTIRMGDAPLPEGYEIPEATREDVDLDAMYINGIKGRQLAFHLAGMEFKSNAEAVQARRDVQKQNAATERSSALRKERDEKKKLPQTSIEEGLIWDLEVDDGAGIAKEDLNGLAHRWGSRLRLRCTEQEIYYRLTGSHTKNSKITPIVYQTLQHAAKSREKGITAVELGPLVGASQGSMHHYMKVLTTMGLCAKVPTIIHAALTNLLVFHSFLGQNENYKATKAGMAAAEPQLQPGVTGSVEDEEADDPSIAPGPATASDWGLTFTELTEEQLMNGFILRERLVKLLDHPSLTNHLLRAKNLLPLLGWKSFAGLRHRRSIPRAIRALIEMGQVENVLVGERKVRCIRLTKYNPDRVPRVKLVEAPSTELQDIGQLVKKYSQPTPIITGVTSLQSIPYQIGEAILQSGSEGLRIIDLRDSLSGLFRRMVEFHFARYEKMTSPPLHLQHRRITSVMESHGRERRLRAFSMVAYREFMVRNNGVINDKVHPPTPPQAGHFAEISHLAFYADVKTLDKRTDKMGTPAQGMNVIAEERVQSAAKAKAKAQVKRPRSATPSEDGNTNVAEKSTAVSAQLAQVAPKPKKPQKKVAKYGQDAQVRGRPRKYIHVVQLDGTVERNIIGSVLPHADLLPIWIYLPHLDKLVPASNIYSGLGPAPDPSEEELQQARTPEWFSKFPRAKNAKFPRKDRREILKKALGSSSKRKESTKEDNDGDSDTRRSKRPRPVYPVEQEIDELISDPEDVALIEEERQVAAPQSQDKVSAGEPSGSSLDPIILSPQIDSPLIDETIPEADAMPAPAEVSNPVPHEAIAESIDPALSSDHSDGPPAIEDQASNFDLDPGIDGMESSPVPARTARLTEARVAAPTDQSVETTHRATPSPRRKPSSAQTGTIAPRQSLPTLQRASPEVQRGTPSQVASPGPHQAPPSPHSVMPGPQQTSSQLQQAPPLPQQAIPSPPMEIARDSLSPPLREISPPQTTRTAPHTPSHHYPAPQPQYYTPPGLQSYTILPPVVYVPPGCTVWPPLPPGYPTTDVPPPGYQGSPMAGPPPPTPGLWHNSHQQQPYQHQLPHLQQQLQQRQQLQLQQQQRQQLQQQQQHQQQHQQQQKHQQYHPQHQHQPYQGQPRSPYGYPSQSPTYSTQTGHTDPRGRHDSGAGHPSVHSSQGMAPHPATPSRAGYTAPIDSSRSGPSSSRGRADFEPQTHPSQTPVSTANHSRNPISRLQSGEIGRQQVSSPTPARIAPLRALALPREDSDQPISADRQRSSTPDKPASPRSPVISREGAAQASPAQLDNQQRSSAPPKTASLALSNEVSVKSTPKPVEPAQAPTPDVLPPALKSVPITPSTNRSISQRRVTPTTDLPADEFAPPEMDTPLSETPVDSSQADAPSIVTLNSLELTPIRAPKKAKKGRMDLGVLRRANEMLVVLQEAGGVHEEHALWKLHLEWVYRVAGTDIPYAPNVAATMDRSVWKRLLQSTKDDGRTDDTVSSVPSSTGAWRNYQIVWLIDTPKDRVQEYMRGLANTVKKLTAPKPIVSTNLPHMQYTEVKLPARHPSSTVQHHLAEAVDNECRELTGDDRRNALCKDPLVLSQLYGRQSGKWARTSIFHLSVRSAIENPGSTFVINPAAGVFQSPMMARDIPIGAFYAVVMTHEKDEALLEWLNSPTNKAVAVKDVPFDIRITHDARRQRTQTRIREHVSMLLALGLISPLSICSEAEAYVVIDTPQMPQAPLKIDTKEIQGEVATYVLHDWAPVYHIAATIPVLLGYLPVRTEEEIKNYWAGYRLACHEILQHRLPEFTPRSSIDSRNVADSPDVIRISDAWKQSLRHQSRWTNSVRLLPVQRDALNETVNWTEATSNVQSDEQLKALAWEFALPEEVVKTHHEARLQKAIDAKANREKRTQAMDEALSARHVKAQRALAFKLSERQAQSKRSWEARVAGICYRLRVQFDNQLLDHVSRQSLTSMTKGYLTDEMIERIIRQYFSHRLIQSVKNNVPPPSMPLQPIPAVRARGPKQLAKKDGGYKPPGTRYRRKWSAEDDEMILDAEAILRARNRDRSHYKKSRVGVERLFPGSLQSSCTARLKKIANTPEKEVYLGLLEDAWYQIWTTYRETDELEDKHPEHNLEFNVQEHVDFLRKHVNKTEMRVEAQARSLMGAKKEPAPELPDSLAKVMGQYKWQHSRTARPRFDMLWQSNNSQDARMGEIGSLSTLELERSDVKPAVPELARHRLRGILKMIIATNPSEYAQPAAIALLQNYDQTAAVNPEIIRMQQEKILVRHSSASSTGRFYSFASAWDTLRLGLFTDDFYQDAARLENKLATSSGVEWPVVGSSGELAALMNMVSDQTVEFNFDSQDFPTIIGGLGLQNTRRLNDISFEFAIMVKKVADPAPVVEPPSLYYCPTPRRWQFGSPGADLIQLHVEVGKAGPDGISKSELQTALGVSRDELHNLLATLSNDMVQQTTFWAGYDTARLVSSSFWPEWQCPARRIKIEDDGRINPEGSGVVMCTPRVWVDIWGRRLEQKWEEAVGCAKGWLISRPGMSERIFREKLGAVMDRLEINDVLQFVLDKGTAQRVWLDGREGAVPPVEAVDVDEEENIIWRPEPKRILA